MLTPPRTFSINPWVVLKKGTDWKLAKANVVPYKDGYSREIRVICTCQADHNESRIVGFHPVDGLPEFDRYVITTLKADLFRNTILLGGFREDHSIFIYVGTCTACKQGWFCHSVDEEVEVYIWYGSAESGAWMLAAEARV